MIGSRYVTLARIAHKKNSSRAAVSHVVPANKRLRFPGTPIGRDHCPLLPNVFAEVISFLLFPIELRQLQSDRSLLATEKRTRILATPLRTAAAPFARRS